MVIRFDNTFVRDLAGLYERWEAAPVSDPELVVLNHDHARELGFDPEWLAGPGGVDFLTGCTVLDGSEPVAQAYAGHQFGGFSPRLGDGRALLLGEFVDPAGRRHDLHLKGSGRTPFARGGDGKAVLGPMLREYVMCEAMSALGVPTTRALAVVSTGDDVLREQPVPGAILARTASSHLRVGTFQYAVTQEDDTLVARLLDHAIDRHHPQARGADNEALAFIEAVMDVQVALVVDWMAIGFVHGVMNTDNMTISGETIDFGPCAFVDAYDPATVFSSIDHGGRYALGNQPRIAQWNLARLAETLLPMIDDDTDRAVERATALLREFPDRYDRRWLDRMARKLAIVPDAPSSQGLIVSLLELMEADHVDWTICLRSLSTAASGEHEPTRSLFVDLAGIDAWLERWSSVLDPDRVAALDSVNPIYIPRNHLVEEALAAATDGDLGPFGELNRVLADPFTERPGLERYAEPAPGDFGRYRTFCGT